jgi:hypothetical protein
MRSIGSLARNYHPPTRGKRSGIGTHTTATGSLGVAFGSGTTIGFCRYATITGASVMFASESARYRNSGAPKCGQPRDIAPPFGADGDALNSEQRSLVV